MAMAKALIAWPEGKENWSGGRTLDQQCSSRWHGRFRLLAFFTMRNSTMVAVTAVALAVKAMNRQFPPQSKTLIPIVYQIHPPPRRAHQITPIGRRRHLPHPIGLHIPPRTRLSIHPQ